ncbi:MAG: hypothetical protein JXQ90_21115 [Cyclobacteriaceae bacterium]
MYRFTLDKSSKKFKCPNCGKQRFVRFWDNKQSMYAEEVFGRCDREVSCSYFRTPKEGLSPLSQTPRLNTGNRSLETFDLVPTKFFEASMRHQESNPLFQFLLSRYSEDEVRHIAMTYGMGSNPFNTKQTAFWQIDKLGNYRTAELISYDCKGKRDRNTAPNWIHSTLKKRGLVEKFNLRQCAYGVHLLNTKHSKKGVCVVEGAKTAIWMALENPQYVWIGTPGVYGLNTDLIKHLDPSNTILIPDVGYEEKWKHRSKGKYTIASIAEFVGEGEDLCDVELM